MNRDGWSGMDATEKLRETKRARDRMIQRMTELKRRGAPEDMRMRLNLDFMDVIKRINELSTELHRAKG